MKVPIASACRATLVAVLYVLLAWMYLDLQQKLDRIDAALDRLEAEER